MQGVIFQTKTRSLRSRHSSVWEEAVRGASEARTLADEPQHSVLHSDTKE